jgi:hypothetical protein
VLPCVSLVEVSTLLDDLLEDSDRIYHRHCALIQRAFHAQWLKTLGEETAWEQTRTPDPDLAEAAARRRLQGCRQALREAAAEMIREQRQQQDARDRAIRAYASHQADQATRAA